MSTHMFLWRKKINIKLDSPLYLAMREATLYNFQLKGNFDTLGRFSAIFVAPALAWAT